MFIWDRLNEIYWIFLAKILDTIRQVRTWGFGCFSKCLSNSRPWLWNWSIRISYLHNFCRKLAASTISNLIPKHNTNETSPSSHNPGLVFQNPGGKASSIIQSSVHSSKFRHELVRNNITHIILSNRYTYTVHGFPQVPKTNIERNSADVRRSNRPGHRVRDEHTDDCDVYFFLVILWMVFLSREVTRTPRSHGKWMEKLWENMRGHARKHDFCQMSEDSESLLGEEVSGDSGRLVLFEVRGIELGRTWTWIRVGRYTLSIFLTIFCMFIHQCSKFVMVF